MKRTMLLLLTTLALTTLAAASCANTTEQTATTTNSGSNPASFKFSPGTGCTVVLDQVSVSLYAGTTDYTVYVVGLSGTTCSTSDTMLDQFPVFHNTTVNRVYVLPGGNGLDMSGPGPDVCVFFSGIATGQIEYLTFQFHER